jgi:hypothetical protein
MTTATTASPGVSRRIFAAVEWLAFVTAAALAVKAGLGAMGFEGAAVGEFNSDSAIPVMQSNDAHWDAYRLYFYGMDRFGAWPFLAANVISRAAEFWWTPYSFHVYSTLWLLLGIAPAMLLAPRESRTLAGTFFLLAIYYGSEVRHVLFDYAHVYPWALPPLLWTWLALRQSWGSKQFSWLRWGLAVLLGAATAWLCLPFAPIVIMLAMAEGARTQALADPKACRPGASRWALQIAAGILPLIVEVGMRHVYKASARAHQLSFQLTADAFDAHRALDGFRRFGEITAHSNWWPWLLLSTAMALGGATWLSLVWLRDRSIKLPKMFIEEIALSAMLWCAAALSLALVVPFEHVRRNDFHLRYLTPVFVFGTLAAWHGAASLLAHWLQAPVWMARTAFVLAAGMGLTAILPSFAASPRYAVLMRTANALAQKAPGAVVVNGYWGTYVYEALAREGGLRALPAQGEWNRLPWRALLTCEDPIVVGTRPPLEWRAGIPPDTLRQYGATLRLVDPKFLEGEVYAERFALYRVESAARGDVCKD